MPKGRQPRVEREEGIQDAVAYRRAHPDVSWMRIGALFNVNSEAVRRRATGKSKPQLLNGGHNTKLTKAQEAIMLKIATRFAANNIQITNKLLTVTANRLLEQQHDGDSDPPLVGTKWSKRFVARYPDLDKVRQVQGVNSRDSVGKTYEDLNWNVGEGGEVDMDAPGEAEEPGDRNGDGEEANADAEFVVGEELRKAWEAEQISGQLVAAAGEGGGPNQELGL